MNLIKNMIVASTVVLSLLLLNGCGDSDGNSPNSREETVTELRRQISTLEKQNADLNNRNNVLSSENRELKEENEKLKEESEKLKEERDAAEDKAKSRYVILSVISYSALAIGIILIAGLILLTRRSKLPISTQDTNHCPRCGWEKTPGDKICRNCKTHF